MYTVVIAEQKHLDCIREYDLFLQPFLEKNNAVFCAWNPAGKTLTDCVPELRKAVQRGDRWRAIIVADDNGQNQKNPFDRVGHRDPVWDPDLPDADNRANRLNARLASYRLAAQQPLTRLAAHLSDFPLVSDGGLLSNDPDFRDYQAADQAKKELQRQIIGIEPQDFIKPAEIICVARRSCGDVQYDIRTSWESHLDLEYSHFADYNLYFPKMRYVLFDMVPAGHRNYRFDNVRFLYALLLLASNDLPNDALQPGKVYVLDCENDTGRLSELLQRYDDRLLATQRMLESEIGILKRTDPEKLTDKEVAAAFCTPTNIPMRPEKSFDEGEVYVRLREFGLFADRPTDEKFLWREEYGRSKKELANYLKQPRKSMRAAVADVHMQSRRDGPVEKIHLLNEQQVGEFRDYLADQESACVLSRPDNLADPTRYQAQAEEAARAVEEHLETRMTRKAALIALGATLLAFLVGTAPVFFTGRLNFLIPAAIGVSLVLLCLVALVCLLIQRGKLRSLLRNYNDALRTIAASIRSNMEHYSEYLGHVCSLLRGNVVDNSLRETCDGIEGRCRVYQKHIADITDLRSNWGLTFSQFLQAGQERDVDVMPFVYDFKSSNTYRYPINGNEPRTTRVEFLQRDNYVELPVDYIRRVTLRREELYD